MSVVQVKQGRENHVCSTSSSITPVRHFRSVKPWVGVLIVEQVKEHSQHTIGVEFSSRTVKLGEKRIKLQVRTVLIRVACTWLIANQSFGILRVRRGSGRQACDTFYCVH